MLKFLRKIWGGGETAPPRGATRVTYWQTVSTIAGGPGVWNWHCQDGNNEVVCGSTQGYTTELDCLDGIDNARDAMGAAWVVKRTVAP